MKSGSMSLIKRLISNSKTLNICIYLSFMKGFFFFCFWSKISVIFSSLCSSKLRLQTTNSILGMLVLPLFI